MLLLCFTAAVAADDVVFLEQFMARFQAFRFQISILLYILLLYI